MSNKEMVLAALVIILVLASGIYLNTGNKKPVEFQHPEVRMTIDGLITNATPNEIHERHDELVKKALNKLGTNGLKLIYIELR